MNNGLPTEGGKRPTTAEAIPPISQTVPAVAGAVAPSPENFDVQAWAALIEEQRRRIAAAAGVDPSKVTIHIGH